MEEENVKLQEPPKAEQVAEQMQQDVAHEPPIEKEPEETKVPLAALQKERKKRQELEMQIEWERQQRANAQVPQEEDNNRYESATKEDLGKVQQEAVRIVEEKIWVKNNPEKFEKINENLAEFLKQRPHLAYAINMSTNRYEEAWALMDALTPKQQQQLKTTSVKKDAPNAPTSVPKAAALNQTVDVMNMSDQEFMAWRKVQKRR